MKQDFRTRWLMKATKITGKSLDYIFYSEETYKERKRFRQQEVGLDAIEEKGEEYFKMINDFFNKDIYKDFLPVDFVNVKTYEIDANKSIDEVYKQGTQIIKDIINN